MTLATSRAPGEFCAGARRLERVAPPPFTSRLQDSLGFRQPDSTAERRVMPARFSAETKAWSDANTTSAFAPTP